MRKKGTKYPPWKDTMRRRTKKFRYFWVVHLGEKNVCLLRISQVINIKHGEQWNAATLSFTLICSGDFLSEKITFLTAIVSLKFLVERTGEKYSFGKESWNCQIAKISRSQFWHFSRYFIRKIDWFPSLLRVLSLINPRQILNGWNGPLIFSIVNFPSLWR